MLIAINGELKTGPSSWIDVADSGFLYGDSLFETIRADGQRLIWQEEHLDRLETCCRLSTLPFDRELAERSLELVRQQIPWPASRVRLTISRGPVSGLTEESGAGLHLATAQPYTPPPLEYYRQGVACCFAPNRRINAVTSLPQMKRGNYADCLYALRHARKQGTFEALFREPDGELLEGSISNLFILLDGILVTPPAGDLVLPGVTRQQMMTAADKLQTPVLADSIHTDQLPYVTEAFLTSSLFGVLPIKKIGPFNIPAGRLASRLGRELGTLFFSPD